MLATLIAGAPAYAQTQSMSSLTQPYLAATPATDMSTQAFTALLGQFFTNPFSAIGGATTLLGSMFLIFNTFILVAGTIWATYGIGVAIVQTAHEGQLMGKKLSQVWLPIRMVTGVASLIPAFGGFSLSQAVLVFATTIGIGAANLGYQGMISGANNMTSLVSTSIVSPRAQGSQSLQQAAYALFRARICMDAQNDYVNQLQQATGQSVTADTVSATTPAGVTGVQYGKPDEPAYCGGVEVSATDMDPRSSSSAGGYRVASVNYDWIASQMKAKATSGFSPFRSQIESLADSWYQSYEAYQTTNGQRPVVPIIQLEGIATTYFNSNQPDASSASQTSQALTSAALQSMGQYGWFGAGAWYATLAEVNSAVAQAAQSINYKTIDPQISDADGGYNTNLADVMKGLDTATQVAATQTANAGSDGNSSSGQVLCRAMRSVFSNTTTPTGNCSFGQDVAMTLIDESTAGAGGATATTTGGLRLIDPIIAMKNMGDYLMVGAEGMYTAYLAATTGPTAAVVGTITSVASAIPGVGILAGAFKQLASVLPMLIGAMFLLGLIMSLWIPMVPFVNWWGGLVQYLTIFFEGIAAGPIWAFVHLDANGEGMGHRTETGYLFIINMLFRPFLMLLGFVASAALIIVMGSFLFWLYPSVMGNIQGNSITGMFSVLGFIFIFWILMHTLVTTLSNMAVLLPDQALAWAGRAIGSQMGRDAEQSTRGHFMAFGRFGQQGVGTGISAAGKARADALIAQKEAQLLARKRPGADEGGGGQ